MPPTDDPSLESLFRQWRDHDDGVALAEVMARTETELLALALRQARDESAAWDLVQECWFTVVREGARWDPEQRVMPWLVGILQIEVRRARRASARVPDPTRLTVGEVPPPDAEAPAAEVRSLVANALRRLPELYREVLTMHLFEDLSHTEIAARTGREPGTVRVQVFRGLAHLRKHIPASLALGTVLAVLAPRSTALPFAPLLDSANATPSVAPTAASSATAPTGTLVAESMAGPGLGWIAAVAAAVVVAVGAWIATSDDSARTPVEVVHTLAPSAGDRPSEIAAESAPSARAPATTNPIDTTPVAARDGVWIVGTALGIDSLERATPTATLRLAGQSLPVLTAKLQHAAHFEIDVSSWYQDGGNAPREFTVAYDHPAAVPVATTVWIADEELSRARAAATSAGRYEIPLRVQLEPPAARVRGTVVFAAGFSESMRAEPRVAGLFEIDDAGDPAQLASEGVNVAADGSFTLRAAHAGRHRLVVASAGSRPTDIEIDLPIGAVRDFGELVLEPGSTLSGRVAIPAGPQPTPATEAWIVCRPAGEVRTRALHGVALAWSNGRFEAPRHEVHASADGSFALAGLSPSEYDLEARVEWPGIGTLDLDDGRPAGLAPPLPVERRAAPAQGIVLRPVNELTVLRVLGSGVPLEGARVARLQGDLPIGGVASDAGGFVGLSSRGAPGRVRVRVAKPGWTERVLELDRGALTPDLPLLVDLERADEPALVRFDGGAVDLAGCRATFVRWTSPDADGRAPDEGPPGARHLRRLLSDGSLAEPIDAGRWWVSVTPPPNRRGAPFEYALPARFDLDLVPGARVLQPLEFAQAGRLRFTAIAPRFGADGVRLELFDAHGEGVPLTIQTLNLSPDGRQGYTSRLNALPFDTAGESWLLEPGAYTLRRSIGDGVDSREVVVQAGRTIEIAG